MPEKGVTTQVITNNPLKESFNSQYQNIKIKNETEYQLTEEMLTPDVTTKNKNIITYKKSRFILQILYCKFILQ